MGKMTIKTEGDRFVVVTRRFAASPEAVYRAHTEPRLIQKWMLGPEGWTMPVCIGEARPGGKIRYEWALPTGGGAGAFGPGDRVGASPKAVILTAIRRCGTGGNHHRWIASASH